MALSIGTASLKLVANADGLTAGLAQSKASIKTWASQAQESIGSKFAGAGSLLKAGLLGGVVGIGAGIGAKIASSFGDFTAKADSVAKLSRSLGLSTESLSGIQHAADLSGVSMDSLKTGFTKFRQQVSGPLDEALYAFADRLQGIQEPGERAKALVAAFGEQGLKIGSMLEGGGDGLKGMVDEAKKLGVTFNDVDAKKVEDANDAFTRLQSSIGGIFQKGIITFAPVFETISAGFTKLLGKLQPVFNWISRTTEAVFSVVGPLIQETIDAVGDALSYVGDLFSGLFGMAGELPTVGEVVTGVFKGIAKAIAYAVDGLRAFAGGLAIVASYGVQAFGWTVEKIGEAGKAAGNEVGVDWLKDAGESLRGFGGDTKKAAQDLRAFGEGQIDAFGGTANQVDAWFAKLGEKKKQAANDPTNAFVGLGDSAAKPVKALLGGALEQGSKEEFSVRAKWETDGKLLQSEQAKANALLLQIKGGIDGVKNAIAAIPALPAI